MDSAHLLSLTGELRDKKVVVVGDVVAALHRRVDSRWLSGIQGTPPPVNTRILAGGAAPP